MVTRAELMRRTRETMLQQRKQAIRLVAQQRQARETQKRLSEQLARETQKRLSEKLAKVDEKVVIESARLQNLDDRIKKLAEGGFSREESAKRNILQDRMAIVRREIKELGRAKDNIRKGYTFEQAYSYAQLKTLATAERKEVKKGAVTAIYVGGKLAGYDDPVRKITILPEFYKGVPAPPTLPPLPELKPIYVGGKLAGYDDPVRKITILPEAYKGVPSPRYEVLAVKEPVGVIKDIEKPPTVISPPPTIKEEIEFRVGKTLLKAETGLKEFAEKVATLTTIPASAAKEEKVVSIKLPTPPGATQITRPVDFRDIDTGILPPMQNLELKSNRILTNFSLGKITESEAVEGLEKTQKQYILEESKRTAALRFVEGAGIGALTILAPPIGWTLIGISGADAISRRKEIVTFAKANPGAAAVQFAAGVAGGLIAGGGIKAIKTKAVKFREPTIKLTGKARIKLMNNILKNLEPEQRIEFAVMKKTATRTFKIDIPSPKNKVTLRIVEFTKNGKKMFAGLEFVDGKVSSRVGGLSIVKGKGGDAKIITRSIRTHTKKGLTNLEVSEYLERVSTKAVKSEGLRSIALTENEVKLAKMFELKGLTPKQIREILRRPMFGVKEAQRRANNPFTDTEFNAAVKISKSRFIISRDIVKMRITNLNKQLGPLIAERDIVDIRVLERGMGSVDIVFNLPKPVFKIKPKIGEVRVPGKVRGIGIVVKKIRKADMPRMPHRTPLSRTFADETRQILQQRISSGKKIRLLQRLRKDVSPVGAFKSIAKRIQQERINLAIKQAVGKVAVVGIATGIKVTPKFKELEKQKQLQLVKTLSRQKDGITIAQMSPTIVKSAEKMALAGKITQVQLQTLKSKLILKQRIITPTVRVPTRVPPPPRVPPPVIIKIPKGVSRTKTVKALAALGKQGVDIITGLKERKKRILRKNLPAFKAFKFGREFVDKNIEASFKLVPSGKKAKGKDIKPFNVGIKFRPSKVNPLFLVEKRKYRLDSPQERAQIRKARGTAPKKRSKSKRNNPRKSKQINWLK